MGRRRGGGGEGVGGCLVLHLIATTVVTWMTVHELMSAIAASATAIAITNCKHKMQNTKHRYHYEPF